RRTASSFPQHDPNSARAPFNAFDAHSAPPVGINAGAEEPVARSIFLCDRVLRPHIGAPNATSGVSVAGAPLTHMVKDDIVALLPDLRAFARFMCREREAADDLVQNTVLAAL